MDRTQIGCWKRNRVASTVVRRGQVPFAASLPRAGAYMCSYNALNGTPACANTFLSERSARVSYGFQGFVELQRPTTVWI